MSRTASNPLSPSLGMPRTHTAMLNEALRQVGELANSTGTGGIVVQRGPLGTSYQDARQLVRPDEWYGVLVNTGPNGEADFTDSRYWVISVLLAQAERAGSYDATKPYLDLWSPNARWGVASNIAESVLGTHTLTTASPTANRGQPLSAACTLVKVQTVDAAKMATQADDAANTVAVFYVLPALVAPVTDISFFPVNLTLYDGSEGTVSTPCTYRYNVLSLAGGTLGTSLSPLWQRPAVGKTDAATHGTAYYSGTTLVLQTTDEVPYKGPRQCS